ncbi:MAG: hypothetical protein ACI841_004022, partial [Planctomycetota bacterium]
MLALILVAGALWMLSYDSGPVAFESGEGGIEASPVSAAETGPPFAVTEELESSQDVRGMDFTDSVGAERTSLEKSFTGMGSVTVVIDVPPDVEFPGYWQVVLKPSKMLQGRETAVRRVIEFERGQYEIEKRAYRDTVEVTIEDLPLGGYSLAVAAEDMNCTQRDFILFKIKDEPDAPGRTNVRVNLRMAPVGFVDGSVIDGDGLSAEDCLITLQDVNSDTRLTARTGPGGQYLFPTVRDGVYRLSVGNPVRPLIDVQEIAVEGAETKVDEIRLPPTAWLTFQIVGVYNEFIEEATIRGAGSSGDSVDVISDASGEAIARYL